MTDSQTNHLSDVRSGGGAPIIRWAGGKTRLLPELLARMPVRFNRYYEPFAGGAALFFRVGPKDATLADVNAGLIRTYRAVRDDVDAVAAILDWHQRHHDSAHYYRVRDLWNDRGATWTESQLAAAFIYLNKTCFNGLWRVNRKGEFNVPMGDYKNPRICDPDALRAASRALQGVDLYSGDYLASVATAQPGDFVYFDSPYDPLNKTSSFTSYAAGGFGDEDQGALARTFAELARRGVKVMLSNSDTPFIRELYASFTIDQVHCGRSINSNGAKRGAVAEVIVRGGY